jgi:hypothetical protein
VEGKVAALKALRHQNRRHQNRATQNWRHSKLAPLKNLRRHSLRTQRLRYPKSGFQQTAKARRGVPGEHAKSKSTASEKQL